LGRDRHLEGFIGPVGGHDQPVRHVGEHLLELRSPALAAEGPHEPDVVAVPIRADHPRRIGRQRNVSAEAGAPRKKGRKRDAGE
jgi:hypothetical protein